MAIEWDDAKLGTGLPDIDEQHKEWIRRFKRVRACRNERPGSCNYFQHTGFPRAIYRDPFLA